MKYEWNFVSSYENEVQLEDYLDAQKTWCKNKSQLEICSVCEYNLDIHFMRYRLFICSDETCKLLGSCKWVLKALQCQITDKISVFQNSHHLSVSPAYRKPGDLNCAMKRYIRSQAEVGLKPAAIMHKMAVDLGLPQTNPKTLLPKVQCFVRTYRNKSKVDNDFVDVMVANAVKHRFRDGCSETTPFTFGFTLDSIGEALIGKGTEDSPLVIGFSTKSLVKRLGRASEFIFHLDATFKLNTRGFPVIVMGLSDMWRQFHPVAFFLVSDLKSPQWTRAIRVLLDLYYDISSQSVSFGFVMMDADNAQRNAFESVAGAILASDKQPTYLMCFFHVMSNVRKHTVGFSEANKRIVYRHVYKIHYARTLVDKQSRIDDALESWKVNTDLQSFSEYFSAQWLEGRYSKWQCVETPTGMAKTNNPCENFNRQLKNTHSMRRLLHLNPLFMELLKVSQARSILTATFATSTRAAPHIIRDFRKLKRERLLTITSSARMKIAFLLESGHSMGEFRVQQLKGAPTDTRKKKTTDEEIETTTDQELEAEEQCTLGWIVTAENGLCDCRTMFKLGSCVHLMAVKDTLGISLEERSARRETFPDKRPHKKRGRPKDVGHALSLS